MADPEAPARTLTLFLPPPETTGPGPWPETALSVVLYLRVSTEDQGRKGYSIPEQQALCLEKARELALAFAGQQGCAVRLQAAEYVDTVGGDFRNRPRLVAALAHVRRESVQWWVCLDPDRLSRKLKIQLDVAEEIEAAGAQLAFVYYNHEDSPEGWAFFQVRGVFSELDKKKILRRLRAGAQRKLKEQRQLAFGLRMWGYRFDRETDTLVVDSPGPDGRPAVGSPAWWVTAWKEWCGRDGLSPEQISRRYHALTGRYVSRQTIRTVLLRRCYSTGEYAVNRRDWTGRQAVVLLNRQLPPGARQAAPRPRPKPPSEHVMVRVPAFVPPELQDAVEETLRRTARRTPHHGTVRMLQGLGRCGICGAALYYGPRGYSGLMLSCSCKTPQTRRLPPDDPRHRAPCPLPSKLAARVEDALWERVTAVLLDPAILAQEAAARARAAARGPDPDALRAELDGVERGLARLTEQRVRLGLLYAHGVWTMAEVEQAAAPLLAQAGALQQLRDDLRYRLATADATGPPAIPADPAGTADAAAGAGTPADTAAALRERGARVLAQLSQPERRPFVMDLVDHIILHPTPRGTPPAIEVRWR